MRASLLFLVFAGPLLAACGGAGTSSTATSEPPIDPGSTDRPPAADDPRQSARDASIFANLDFEELDADGAPVGWTCTCAGAEVACKVDASSAHGEHALVLPSGCTAYQTATTFDRDAGVRVDYRAYGGHQYAGDFQVLAVGGGAVVESIHAAAELADSTAYVPMTGEAVLRTADASSVTIYVTNSNGALDAELGGRTDAPDLHVDDIVAVQDSPNPPAQIGSLVLGRHVNRIGLAAGDSQASLFTPLPLDYASQVPLYVELTVNPPSAAESVEYVAEAEHDWGAIVRFAPGAAASDLRIEWRSVALVRMTPRDDYARVYAKLEDPAGWTKPSAIAQSDYAPLATLSKGLVSPSARPEDKMRAIVGWTSKHLGDGTGQMVGLDAKTVFDTHVTSCTGYANTAMAMGRALGVPARHVANMMVGTSQDMHSVDEFWLGESLGWRRVEPQASWSFLPDDYGFVVRLILPDDEVGSTVGFPGIPKNEFTEYRDAPTRFTFAETFEPVFTDCGSCANRADRQALLRGSDADLRPLFEAARAKWQTTFSRFTGGSPSASDTAARRGFVGARSLDDVRRILDTVR